LRNGRLVTLRAARREDIPAVQRFVRGLSFESRRNRFFAPLRELTRDQLDRMTRSRPPDEVSLVGETTEDADSRIVAMGQYATCEPTDAEVAVVVDDAWQRQSLGTQLLRFLAELGARSGLAVLSGFVLADNRPMLALLTRLGYEFSSDDDPRLVRVAKPLLPLGCP